MPYKLDRGLSQTVLNGAGWRLCSPMLYCCAFHCQQQGIGSLKCSLDGAGHYRLRGAGGRLSSARDVNPLAVVPLACSAMRKFW